MDILFDEKNGVFKIDTEKTSYVMAIMDTEKLLGHAYYGKKISDVDVRYLLRTSENPFLPSVNGRDRGSVLDSFPFEFPGCNVGDYRESAVELEDGNGCNANFFTYRSHRIFAGKQSSGRNLCSN